MFYVYNFLVNIVITAEIHVEKILLYTVILLITAKFHFANTLIFKISLISLKFNKHDTFTDIKNERN